MDKILLDSCVLVDLLKENPEQKVIETVESQRALGRMFCTCDLVLAEFVAGLNPNQYQKVKAFLDDLYHLASNSEIALEAGRLYWQLYKNGKTTPLADCFIIILAKSYQSAILTRDKKHFQNLNYLAETIFV